MFEWLFGLGSKSGMPKYVAFLALLQVCILFVPEAVLTSLGAEALNGLFPLPSFVQHYVNSSTFKSAMYIFWLASPFTLIICTPLWIQHINCRDGFAAYLARRRKRLEGQSEYNLLLGCTFLIALYIWSTGIYLKEPTILGDAIPAKSRFMMLLIHGGSIGLLLPASVAIIVTEIRAILGNRVLPLR